MILAKPGSDVQLLANPSEQDCVRGKKILLKECSSSRMGSLLGGRERSGRCDSSDSDSELLGYCPFPSSLPVDHYSVLKKSIKIGDAGPLEYDEESDDFEPKRRSKVSIVVKESKAVVAGPQEDDEESDDFEPKRRSRGSIVVKKSNAVVAGPQEDDEESDDFEPKRHSKVVGAVSRNASASSNGVCEGASSKLFSRRRVDESAGSPVRASKLPAPVTASAKKDHNFSQESWSDVEVLGMAPAPRDYEFEMFESEKEVKAPRAKVPKSEEGSVKDSRNLSSDDEGENEVEAKSKARKVSSPSSASSGKPKKKKRLSLLSTDEVLSLFDYAIPLGVKRLPSLRAFNAPFCNCSFWGGQVRMNVRPTAHRDVIPKTVMLKTGAIKTFIQYGKPVSKEDGGALRSWRCPGWTMSMVGEKKVFGRKEGFSRGDNCRSIKIEEVKEFRVVDGNVVITKVGLTEDAIDYLKGPGARISEKR